MAENAWWADIPLGIAVHLVGVSAERLAVALDPLPDTAPAVVSLGYATARSFTRDVDGLLDDLERVAVALFPKWLRGADQFERPNAASIAAVRALADSLAAQSRHFGPFLSDLAVGAFRVRHGDEYSALTRSFPAAARAAGLARVIADSYKRNIVALLIDVPRDLTASEQRSLVSAADWLCRHGDFTAWLTGDLDVDTLPTVVIRLPEVLASAPLEEVRVRFPAISGEPRPDSSAEQALERALMHHSWAAGRRWNHIIQAGVLTRPYRVDLVWDAERLVVEIDGPEHRGRLKYADDRERDVELMLLGYYVARFTNERVEADTGAVVAQIQQLLFSRRQPSGRRGDVED